MTRFEKVYEDYETYKKRQREKLICKIAKNNSLNREGYGYIKRRVGLLSNEVGSPTYLALSELSDFISKNIEVKS
ncbi:MAG: hypothetical protein DRG78_17710 [Epsilonproteobacteria bacterium]|nr:MAG: hypothetical protein DRG78_17710 [Campylobacterota bacterium]